LHDDLALEVRPDVEPEVVVGGTGEAVHAGVAAAAIGGDGVPERHASGRRHRVDDAPTADVEELEAPELAPPDMALDDLLVAEQHPLRFVLHRAPAQHDPTLANVCSYRNPATRAPPSGSSW